MQDLGNRKSVDEVVKEDERLPVIPDKMYFTIGEVSDLVQLEQHVLRYWEGEFPMLKPEMRNGRRYYRRKDVQLVFYIKDLLHVQGYKIEGARSKLAKNRKIHSLSQPVRQFMKEIIERLEETLLDLENIVKG